MQLIIHRGAHEIGGTVVELSAGKTKLLLDIGQPLSENSTTVDVASLRPDAVLISHPHQDHFGLIDQLDPAVPVYIGALSKNLICASREFIGQALPKNQFIHFTKWQPFEIGDFTITPYLMDHSAADAYAFLIEAEGKRIFYSGDFRSSGNKAFLFDKLLRYPPSDIDLLLMEGTMMRRDSDQFPDEASVRRKIETVLKEQQNITFIIASSQNIDRLVSAMHACQRTSKILVIDIYTAWVLEQLRGISDRVPNMNWKQVKVYAEYRMDERLKNDPDHFHNFRSQMYKNRVTKETIEAEPTNFLYYSKMSRFKTMEFYKKFGPINLIYSQWLGYLKMPNDEYFGAEQIAAYQNDTMVNFIYAHTTGHATLDTLKKMVACLKPTTLVPVHTEFPEDYAKHFKKVTVLNDGAAYNLS